LGGSLLKQRLAQQIELLPVGGGKEFGKLKQGTGLALKYLPEVKVGG
jgi:hypothetical protein